MWHLSLSAHVGHETFGTPGYSGEPECRNRSFWADPRADPRPDPPVQAETLRVLGVRARVSAWTPWWGVSGRVRGHRIRGNWSLQSSRARWVPARSSRPSEASCARPRPRSISKCRWWQGASPLTQRWTLMSVANWCLFQRIQSILEWK